MADREAEGIVINRRRELWQSQETHTNTTSK
jgi:anti-anti-sigma regulatory factor